MTPQDSFTVTVEAGKPRYAPGEVIQLVVQVVNHSSHAATIEFSSSQRSDFWLPSAAGEVVWQWCADLAFAQVMGTEQLAPGAALRYRAGFQGCLEPGAYQGVGRVTSLGRALEATAEIVVR